MPYRFKLLRGQHQTTTGLFKKNDAFESNEPLHELEPLRYKLLGGQKDDAPVALKSPTTATRKELKSELEELTVADLRERAAREGVNLHGAATKDDVVRELLKAEAK